MLLRTIVTLSMLALLPIMAMEVNAGVCVIDRININPKPITWGNYNRTSSAQLSSYTPESCNVPEGSYITGITGHYRYDSKRSVLTHGLEQGTYGMTLIANGDYVKLREVIVSASYVKSISTAIGDISNFNGLDLHGLQFKVFGLGTSKGKITCRANNYVCKDYMTAEYKLNITYED